MRTVSGAQGPLNCHGQSSSPIRRYGGHAGAFDTDHLKTKLVLLLEGAIVAIENPYQATSETMTRRLDRLCGSDFFSPQSFSSSFVFYKVLIFHAWRIHLVSPPMFWDILLQIRRRGHLKQKYNQNKINMELKHGTFCPQHLMLPYCSIETHRGRVSFLKSIFS